MEQNFYAQVVKLCRKDLKFVGADKNKNEAKFKFQSQSARSKLWFDLHLDWIEINFSTCGSDFYNKRCQSHDDTQDDNTFKNVQVPIGNAKCVESLKFLILAKADAKLLKQQLFNISFDKTLKLGCHFET